MCFPSSSQCKRGFLVISQLIYLIILLYPKLNESISVLKYKNLVQTHRQKDAKIVSNEPKKKAENLLISLGLLEGFFKDSFNVVCVDKVLHYVWFLSCNSLSKRNFFPTIQRS